MKYSIIVAATASISHPSPVHYFVIYSLNAFSYFDLFISMLGECIPRNWVDRISRGAMATSILKCKYKRSGPCTYCWYNVERRKRADQITTSQNSSTPQVRIYFIIWGPSEDGPRLPISITYRVEIPHSNRSSGFGKTKDSFPPFYKKPNRQYSILKCTFDFIQSTVSRYPVI